MSKPNEFEVKPPAEVSSEEQFHEGASELDSWKSSENPHEGRFPETDDECAGDCPACDNE